MAKKLLKTGYGTSSTSSVSSVTNESASRSKSWNTSKVSKAITTRRNNAQKQLSGFGDYKFSRQGDYDKAINQYVNRKPFEYDLNKDALYQQYAEQYKALGNQAMQETQANASTLTGGYANSYAASAGAQAYNDYMQQLNDIVPDLYSQAYNRYQNEGNDLYNKVALYGDLDSNEYNKYQGQFERLYNKAQLAEDIYNNEWNRNAVAHSSQNDYSRQTESSKSTTSQSEYAASGTSKSSGGSKSSKNSQLGIPTYEQMSDVLGYETGEDVHDRAIALLGQYGLIKDNNRNNLADDLPSFNNWKKDQNNSWAKTPEQQLSGYKKYISEYMVGMINAAYGK